MSEREQVSFRVEAKTKKKLIIAAAQAGMKIKDYLLKGRNLLLLEQEEQGKK